MSTAFRLFLLILAAFLALWAYQLRKEDLALMTGARPLVIERTAAGPFQSPVEGTIGPASDEALVLIQGVSQPPPPEDEGRKSGYGWGGLYAEEIDGPPLEYSADDAYEGPAAYDGAVVYTDPPGVDDRLEPAEPQEYEEPPALDGAGDLADGEPTVTDPSSRPVEVPSADEPGLPEPTPENTYVVQDGDSLWKIAEKLLGRGHRYPLIAKANRDVLGDSALVRPGMRLRIPAE